MFKKCIIIINSILILLLLVCIYKNNSRQFEFKTLVFFYENLKYVVWYSVVVLLLGLFISRNNKKTMWAIIATSMGLGLLTVLSYSTFNPW